MARGILAGGILAGGILSGGILSGGFCPGGFCPRTGVISHFTHHVNFRSELGYYADLFSPHLVHSHKYFCIVQNT